MICVNCRCGGFRWRELPIDCEPVRSFGVLGGEVVAALSQDRFGGARPDGWRRKRVLERHRAFILERIGQTSHLTLHGLKQELPARGVHVSHNASVAVSAARGTAVQKKRCSPSSRPRADIARRRLRWRSWPARLDPRHLVFIDATWIKTNMALLRGWGPKGHRLQGFAPHGHWRTLTFLAALRLRRSDQRRMLPRLCRTAAHSST